MLNATKEYGGYLPFELSIGVPYHNWGSDRQINCNSGLTAIYCALKAIAPARVFLPHFICPTVDAMIASLGIEVCRYFIGSDFRPKDICCSDEDCVILVNYFGVNTHIVEEYRRCFRNVIIDNTQAFFAAPVFEDGVYNVYSCRKFIGTADGGYLIGKDIPELILEKDFSSHRAGFLLMQYEYGTNGAYKESLENYEQIRNERRAMSILTERMLAAVDYDSIIAARQRNFQALHNNLSEYNKLDICFRDYETAYSYPFMVEKDIRQLLVERKIYVPFIWREKAVEQYQGKPEYELSRYICHLPLDQRYGVEDMEYISNTILDILEAQR